MGTGADARAGQSGQTGQPPHPLTSDLAWLLAQASHALQAQVTGALDDVGISPRQHHVLTAASCARLTQSALAHLVGLDKTTLVNTLDELETDGLVIRVPAPQDRRARLISVTAAGRKKLEEGTAVVERVQADVLRALPDGMRTALLEGLSDLIERRLSDPMPAGTCAPRRQRGA